MNEKKDLDRLFREKFKDFEVAPPEFVWDNIQEILQEKKKRRVIPIWFKLSGVAALLILSGLLATLFFDDTNNPVNANPVVIDNTTTSPADALKASPDNVPANAAIPSAAGTSNVNSNSPAAGTTTVANSSTAVATNNNNNNNNNNNAAPSVNRTNSSRANRALPSVNNNSAVANINRGNNKNNADRTNTTGTVTSGNAEAFESPQKPSANSSASQTAGTSANNNITGNNTANDAVAAAKLRNDARNFARNPNSPQNKANRNTNVNVPAQVAIEEITATVNGTANKDATPDKAGHGNLVNNTNPVNAANNKTQGIAANGTANSQNTNPTNAENNTAQRSNLIIDKNIPQTEALAQTAVDTTATVVPENELEKLLQEKLKGTKEEDKAVAENTPKERWVLKPQVAPVFYNSLSSGSPINEQFASNTKSYDNDLSFGLGVNYAVTDRITIRSGINSVNLSYATNDIAFYASLNNATSNIGTSKTANIVVQNGANVPDVVMIDGQPTQAVSGSMLQKTGYIEIPLEMSYALVNKKFGIDVIGGVSSLFLNQNNVSVVSNTGLSTQVGEAQNLNNLHFSTNVGLGFKYHFWESFQVNFEPMFKYQVNAYSRDAGNFKPYFIGLYSGVSFSF